MKHEEFIHTVSSGYEFKGDYIHLGGGILNGEVYKEAAVKIPLKMMNRHGLIAGSTGSGKTKTLQIIAEHLSQKGVPVLMMDVKGDLSGIAAVGSADEKVLQRMEKIGIPYNTNAAPVEFLTLSNEKGTRLRATISEFGPILMSKILDLNDTQQGVVALVFKYCDDKQLPLLDLDDFKKVLQYITNEGKAEISAEYGTISSASTGTIMRKLLELEQQGAEMFFGEPSFEVTDLVRYDNKGHGMVSIMRLTDIQDKPKLFSTFMLQLMAEVYATFPEIGDPDKPKLVIFIDEAHLVFDTASKTLISQIETTIKLIRSKGVGIFFITQNPSDVPNSVLGQLGLKIQHSLRAFTAKDRKDIKLTSENFPLSPFYDIENIITQLGIGEALVTSLNEKGIPTPLVHTMLRAPESRMDILTPQEIDQIISQSRISNLYNRTIDRESAYEILTEKLNASTVDTTNDSKRQSGESEKKSVIQEILESDTTKQITRNVKRTINNEISKTITRTIFGMLGIKTSSTKKKTSGWF